MGMPADIGIIDTMIGFPTDFEHYDFIRKQVEEGRQAYVIYPLVEESEKVDLRAATEMADHLAQDVVERAFYRSKNVPKTDRAEWIVRLGGRTAPIQARIGDGIDESDWIVGEVVKGSAAERAGLEVGDDIDFAFEAFKETGVV